VNSDHIPAVAKKVKELGAYIVNILPMIPVPGTPFAKMRAPTPNERKALQDICEPKIKQMRHCRQCRADAVGLLDEDRSAEFAHFTCGEETKEGGPIAIEIEGKTKHKVAVASSDGRNVDLGYGQTERFYAFLVEEGNIVQLGQVQVDAKLDEPVFGKAHKAKLENMAITLRGYDAVVATEFSDRAVDLLKQNGIAAYALKGEVESAVREASDNLYKKRAEIFE
jgi:nitrogen fixation protein NifB